MMSSTMGYIFPPDQARGILTFGVIKLTTL